MKRLEHYWYSLNPVSLALWPLGLLFCTIALVRGLSYRRGLLKSYSAGVPVIVVGNLTVGGSGKTPLVIRLIELLQEAGHRPGIVSRGYKGRAGDWPRAVSPHSDPHEVGDEPVLLARRCDCPVMVGPDRVAAARALLKTHHCDVIVSDDGLQHYRLKRDLEIVVIDGNRRLGNGFCLPAGPLREPSWRLRGVDFVVGNGAAQEGEYLMTLAGERAINLTDSSISCSLAGFRGVLVHAIAGIGDPPRFFRYLRDRGIRTVEHPFPDHHPFVAADLEFGDELPVLMTEKDAVKCQRLAPEGCWYVPVEARLDTDLERRFLVRVSGWKS